MSEAENTNGSEPLKNARQEAFARRIVEGKTQADAYIETFSKAARWRKETVYVRACELAALPEVAARIRHLKRVAAGRAVLTARELQETLSRQVREAESGGNWRAVVSTGRLLADLLGYCAPAKEEVTARIETPGGAFRQGSPESEAAARVGLFLMKADAQGVAGAKTACEAWDALRPFLGGGKDSTIPAELRDEILERLSGAPSRAAGNQEAK